MRVSYEESGAGIDQERSVYNVRTLNETRRHSMKLLLSITGILIFLAGLTFFLQGVNILPGSFMTGDPQWAINGAIGMVIGGGLFWFARSR